MGAGSSGTKPDVLLDEFEQRVRRAFESSEVPGAAATIWVDGRSRTLALGVLNVDTGAEVTPDAMFEVGSITKLLTAAQVVRAVDEGRVSLGTRVVDVLPWFRLANPSWTSALTLEHLLTHRGGFEGDVDGDFGRGADAVRNLVESLRLLSPGTPPGDIMSYANSGYVVLGAVLEQLYGEPWAEQASRDLTMLGLTETRVYPERALGWRVARGHVHADQTRPHPMSSMPWALAPAGSAVVASARDLMALGSTLAGVGPSRSDTFLTAGARESMMTERCEAPSPTRPGKGRGLGWEIDARGPSSLFGHNGQTFGQAAYFWCCPAVGTAACLLVNSDRDEAVAEAAITRTFEDALGAPPSAPSDLEQVPPEVSARLEGRYAIASRSLVFTRGTVTLRRDELVDRVTGGAGPQSFRLLRDRADGYLVGLDDDDRPALRLGLPLRGTQTDDPFDYVYMGNRAVLRSH